MNRVNPSNPDAGGSSSSSSSSSIISMSVMPQRRPEQEGDEAEDASALEQLSIRAYDQDQLEAEVFRQADQALEQQERQRQTEICLKELRPVILELQSLRQSLGKLELELKRLYGSNATWNRAQQRKAQSCLDEQEKLIVLRNTLRNKQKQLAQDLTHLKYDWALDSDFQLVQDDDGNNHEDDVSADGSRLAANETQPESIFAPENQAETDQEKKIRLGEMTAFGNVLQTKTDSNELSHYNTYVADQRRLNAQIAVDSVSKSSKAVSVGRKGQDRSRIRSRTVSSDEDESEAPPAYGTDDSDWAGTDDEADDDRKKRKRGLVDDGERADYLKRLDKWQSSHEADELNAKSEELEGGLHVPSRIWDQLYNYQRVCVQWLWELHQQKVGGILGDEMGLGKTIQIIAFLASLSFSQRRIGSGNSFGPILIVCPTTVMHQWVKEFHKWWPMFRVAVLHESGSHTGSRQSLIRSVVASKGVLITSFNGVVAFNDALVQGNFDYVILDEGHKIRNPDAKITLTVKTFPTSHRIILSGSPLQNNLKELWSLFDFIYPGKLGTLPVFMQQFSVPITQGGYSNASRVQVATAYKCATVLRDTINPYLLRRMKSDVKQHINLPEKNEQVLFCKMTDQQRDIYREYLDSGEIKSILDGRLQIFVGLINLRKICNHPDLYDGGPRNFGPNQIVTGEDDEEFGYWKRSGKMIVIEALLKLWKKQGHRVLLFSQSRQMLNILERFVRDRDYQYMKLDGTTAIGSRQTMIDKFNNSKDVFVFLLTTKVGGLGVNLTGASRVVIFDPDWNPSTDTQARERAWRIGQEKQVTIYRLMTAGTIEEKIYHRQIFKQFLVNRVLKDPKQKRFFKSNDLYELFTLNEGTSDKTETSAIFAGTGSDVKIKKSDRKSRKTQSSEGRSPSMPLALPIKRVDSLKQFDVKSSLKRIYDNAEDASNIENDDEEKKRLLERVRKISRKIASEDFSLSSSSTTSPKPNQINSSSSSSRTRKSQKSRRPEKESKKRRIDGEKISHLVKSGTYQAPKDDPEEVEKNSAEQDNYVLSKLFKKSGVHSAVQHDAIIDGEGDDYVLIEGEAEKVAKEAVESLRLSRRQCFRAEAGVPTWTGSHGSVATKPRFGKKSRNSNPSSSTALKSNKLFSGEGTKIPEVQNLLTSADLLAKMKERNRFLPSDHDNDSNQDNLFQPDHGRRNSPKNEEQEKQLELLADIRNFIAFQAKIDGQAQTYELLERFKTRLPPQQSPLFKALLKQICHFSRDSDGRGIWSLKTEFA
ncbi:hypothetical protein TCAL_00795 [Tigriopus californicus]|uniref:DNA excision repair protein ERCC-6 n=1 Tax=Tigriopus californicus TaxID=6832 RepID=A0A553NEX9_TIGCA|nr:DNA excision repair protein ERCC-6-like [Tigriopus californicus]TRY63996.1 hypothetical protein TCAL_00795 [Tigriopus californicus]|eukprot:TCALIF_00795-PA protein Name:"Similar to ERCC6 DNA excision repair protein ERCC-6 (Homo sapiens)" AED:0.01 eAED:0.01 QI:143/1/1/1/1/1/3/1176/1270